MWDRVVLSRSKTTDRTSRLEAVLEETPGRKRTKGESMDERRRSRRVAPAHEVNVTIKGNRSARVVDLSPYGAHVELASALNPRGECRISLPLLDGIVRINARVVHCKLTELASPDSGGQLMYRAGLQFLDIDPRLAASINLTYPPPFSKPVRRGPIKVKVNVDALAHGGQVSKHGAN